jgi:hypothetical protein
MRQHNSKLQYEEEKCPSTSASAPSSAEPDELSPPVNAAPATAAYDIQ